MTATEDKIRALIEAATALADEVCDYSAINLLGDGEEKHNVKLVRAAAAIVEAEPQEVRVKPLITDAAIRLQKDAGIPHMPTQLTYDARMAIVGEGPLAYDWADKPHRIVYDLCREIERIAAIELTPTAVDASPAPDPVSKTPALDEAMQLPEVKALVDFLRDVDRAGKMEQQYGETQWYWRDRLYTLRKEAGMLLAALKGASQ